jgi:hypothetical protein
MSRLAKFLGIRMLRPGLIPPRIWNELLDQLRCLRIQEVIGGTAQIKQTGTTIEIDRQPAGVSSAETISFRLTAGVADSSSLEFFFQVSSSLSTVIDGTNGDAFDLGPSGTDWKAASPIKFDQSAIISQSSDIVLLCEIDPNGVASDFTLAALDPTESEEVYFDPEDLDVQIEARLLIGRVHIEDETVTVTQATRNPQRLTFAFTNGVHSRVFDLAPLALPPLPDESS